MKRKESTFWHQKREFVILGSMVLLSFMCMQLDQTKYATLLKMKAQHVAGILNEGFTYLPRLIKIKKQNKKLLEQVGHLELERMTYQEALFENKRMQELLDFKKSTPYLCVAAEIVGRSSHSTHGLIYLNIGSQQGCRKNQALINDKGLVGKILSVTPSTAVGQLIVDQNYRVSAKIQRSSAHGIVRWLYGSRCILEGVSLRNDVRPGDDVVTSGFSDIYPPGLPVGKVVEVKETPAKLFKKITLRTNVNFDCIEEVLVLQSMRIPEKNDGS